MNMNGEAEHDCVAVLRLPGPGCSHGSRRSSDITPATGLHWALGASYGHLAGHRPATPEHHKELNLDLLNIVLYTTNVKGPYTNSPNLALQLS